MPKDEALVEAKRNYVFSLSDADAHPYFWASCIAFGNMEAIMPNAAYHYGRQVFFLILLLIGAMAIIAMIFKGQSNL